MSRRAFLCLSFVAVAFVVLLLGAMKAPKTHFAQPNPAGAVVKITMLKGHGSGVHLGDGFVLTAAHVVGDMPEVGIKTDTLEVQKAEVLWVNKGYDVALLKVLHPERLKATPLVCETQMQKGALVYSEGNPLGLEGISTWGRIAGKAQAAGPWRNVLITDMATIPGMSGGGVYDMGGRLIGITVGAMTWGTSPMSRGLSGIGYIVPGESLCLLMGRM
ncbi:S1 family peptidase [Aurantimonas coralicida]|uniref:S1 family peptidase n=1 Tax=Aurantimonas coralicida TaxID=182270 RepID=UPI001E5AF269|nr:serine protease [Aurantimonas coralicida]MCD1644175.1 serine protease [Aurantimonas coralicida]